MQPLSLLLHTALLTAPTHAFATLAPRATRSAATAPVLSTPILHPLTTPPSTTALSPPSRRAAQPVLALRGGLSALMPTTVGGSFNAVFACLSVACAALVFGTREKRSEAEVVPKEASSLQWRFLFVFWMFKMADWLQGPYFYEVYASKVIGGVAMSTQGVANLFLFGFGSTALFGAVVGGLVDSLGRKRGSLAFAAFYAVSALSTKCSTLPLLLAGRVAGGIGTALLFSAPESWLVSEHQRSGLDGKFLGKIFGLAYFGDAIVAILAGQLAGLVAAARGPTAPFELSTFFLAAGAGLVLLNWRENFGGKAAAAGEKQVASANEAVSREDGGTMVKDAMSAMLADRKIMLVGAVQALFEGAMYIFVLQWPPALKSALGAGVAVPFGTIFSCFMVCCMLGSTLFSALSRAGVAAEDTMAGMLSMATLSMLSAMTLGLGGQLLPLIAAFFAFEACVGMYFPLIGTLRSK